MNKSQFEHHISTKWHNYISFMQQLGYDNLLISSGDLLYPFRDDLNYPYKTNPYFKEWLHLNDRPGCLLHITPAKDRPVLFIKNEIDFWDTDPDAISAEIPQHFEIRPYTTKQQLKTQLQNLSKTAYIGEPSALCESINAEINPEALLNRIDFARAGKTPYEHQCLREATAIAARGHAAAKQAFEADKSEYEIHMDYLQAIQCVDTELPYSNIIALNENAATLHHMKLNRNKPAQHLSFLIDAGANYHGYAADITRTYAQEHNSVFIELIKGVSLLQQQLVSMVKPGVNYADLHEHAHRLIAELLSELGIITLSEDDDINLVASRAFFPHGLGHLLGVQVHDRGGRLNNDTYEMMEPHTTHPFLRFTRSIEANMVFTIEPGIYFIPSLLTELRAKHSTIANWKLVNQLTPFGGIRVEDNIIVHTDNTENVTHDVFSKI